MIVRAGPVSPAEKARCPERKPDAQPSCRERAANSRASRVLPWPPSPTTSGAENCSAPSRHRVYFGQLIVPADEVRQLDRCRQQRPRGSGRSPAVRGGSRKSVAPPPPAWAPRRCLRSSGERIPGPRSGPGPGRLQAPVLELAVIQHDHADHQRAAEHEPPTPPATGGRAGPARRPDPAHTSRAARPRAAKSRRGAARFPGRNRSPRTPGSQGRCSGPGRCW